MPWLKYFMQQNDKTLPNWLIVGLFSLWILATVIGLWWFQQTKLKSFISIDDEISYYQPTAIEQLLSPYLDQLAPALPKQQTLLHFWRPDCLCNNISQRHFSRLLTEFSSESLRIIIIAHPNSSDQEIDDLQQLNGDRLTIVRAQEALLNLPSSPALALLNEENKLGYFGPYGFGAFCTVSDEGFLSSIINKMANADQLTTFTNVIGEGCFCSWQ